MSSCQLSRRLLLTCNYWRNVGASAGRGACMSCHTSAGVSDSPQICIVGSGPAGFYTAQHILKNHPTAEVSIFEKLPVPFGLVRYGVAPDHPEIKNASNAFEVVATEPRCTFLGNVEVGKDVRVAELLQMYNAVVLAYGAEDDKALGIPGENLNGVYSARSFVGWYNGLPAHANLNPILDCETAVVIGQGNVALDVARMLLAPVDLLQHTDICEYALEALTRSRIRKVFLVGRRGPLQVSFTIKELREMIRLPGCRPYFNRDDFLDLRSTLSDVPRQRRRLIELMCSTALDEPKPDVVKVWDAAHKEWELLFFSSPVAVIGDGSTDRVDAVRLENNELVECPDGSVKAVGLGTFEEIPCGMVLRSIGYKSVKVDAGVPFDAKLGIIPNQDGRVVDRHGSENFLPGLYCSGWVKHGPVGVIVTTMNEAYATGQKIVEDIKKGQLPSRTVEKPSFEVTKMLHEKGIKPVTFQDYRNIDLEELNRGKLRQKPREKIVNATEMLDVAFRTKPR